MPIKFYLNSGVKKEKTMIKLGVNFAIRWSFLRLKSNQIKSNQINLFS